jgi:hypothetical protein
MSAYVEPTRAGRIRVATKIAVVVVLLLLAGFALPRYIGSLPTCDGVAWLRALFVAIPLLWAAVVCALFLQSWRALRAGRWPVAGADVLFRQRVVEGWRLWLFPVNAVASLIVFAWGATMVGPRLLQFLERAAQTCNA